MNLRKSFTWLAIAQTSSYAVPLLIIPYLARTLGSVNYGHYSVALAAAILLSVVADWGYVVSGTIRVSHASSCSAETVSRIVVGGTYLRLLMSPVWVLIYMVLGNISGTSNEVVLWMVMAAGLVAQSLQIPWYFQGVGKVREYALVAAASRLVQIPLLLYFVDDVDDVLPVAVIWTLSGWMATLLQFGLALRNGHLSARPSRSMLKNEFICTRGYVLPRISSALYTNLGGYLAGYLGPVSASLYGLSEQIYRAAQGVSGTVAQTFLGATNRGVDLIPHIKRVAMIGSMAIMLIFGLLAVFGNQLISIIFGAGFVNSKGTMLVLLAAYLLSFLNSLIGYPLFSAMGRVGEANRTSLLGLMVFIGWNGLIFLNEMRGIVLLAFGVLLAEFSVLLVRFFMLRRILNHAKFV